MLRNHTGHIVVVPAMNRGCPAVALHPALIYCGRSGHGGTPGGGREGGGGREVSEPIFAFSSRIPRICPVSSFDDSLAALAAISDGILCR